ncbi:hypothetical protein LCGC14_1306320 [marine sediment metagenome]|uniref:Uncharacterized protein n=1 Tax=marine sediment metagenome TaxID=412755 RepID=A0A0F9NR38_9ZZZZ
MVKFIDIDPKDIDTTRIGRRGRVSYPILKAFMERNSKVSKLDLTGFHKNPTYLRAVLAAYVKSHQLPIKIFAAGGELHLMRLDLDNDNKSIPWDPEAQVTDGASGLERDMEAVPITASEVKKRHTKEKGATAK